MFTQLMPKIIAHFQSVRIMDVHDFVICQYSQDEYGIPYYLGVQENVNVTLRDITLPPSQP